MTVSILATTDNGDPAFGLKQGTLARKPNVNRDSVAVAAARFDYEMIAGCRRWIAVS